MLRGPGCCLGSLVGLAAGAVLTVACAAALWRYAPALVEDLLDQAAYPLASRRPLVAGGTRPQPREPAGPGARPQAPPAARAPSAAPAAAAPPAAPAPIAPPADAGGAARRAVALQAQVRERLRRIATDAGRSKRIQGPIEFSEEEVRAALADPLGPFPDFPDEVRADLLPGRVRLSWKVRVPGAPQRWEWSRRVGELDASLELAPRIEHGRLLCPVVAGRLGPLPLAGPVARALAPIALSAPPLPPREGLLVPSGIGGVEIAEDRLRLVPDPLWKPSGL
jgi:hypothetical protein